MNEVSAPIFLPRCRSRERRSKTPITFSANRREALHGERDEEHQFGVQIPLRGWLLDADTFQTRAKNFLDHSNLGESSIYYPVTASADVSYGSGFHNGSPSLYPGNYLPQHTTLDLSAAKTIRENTTVSANFLNVANRRVLLDNSLTFGGFHYNDPREIYGEVRFRFHY